MTKTRKTATTSADRYLDLVRQFPLRPIRTKAAYAGATQLLRELLVRDAGLDEDEADYTQMLALLVRQYDEQHASILQNPKALTPIGALKALMEENGMNVSALGDLLGSGSGQASMVLAGKRELSKANIRTLAKRFCVSPALFI